MRNYICTFKISTTLFCNPTSRSASFVRTTRFHVFKLSGVYDAWLTRRKDFEEFKGEEGANVQRFAKLFSSRADLVFSRSSPCLRRETPLAATFGAMHSQRESLCAEDVRRDGIGRCVSSKIRLIPFKWVSIGEKPCTIKRQRRWSNKTRASFLRFASIFLDVYNVLQVAKLQVC